MGMNPSAAGGPGTNALESGGATVTKGGRNVTGTGFGPMRSANPKTSTAGETFASGEAPVLQKEFDETGDIITSSWYEHVENSESTADHGTPGNIPNKAVINRGYLNSKTPLPTPTRKGTQRQSY